MTTLQLDPYTRGSSLVHELDPRVKVVLTLAYILTTSLTPPGAWPTFLLLAAMGMATTILAEIPASLALKRMLVALPFTLAAVPLSITTPGTAILQLPWGWSVTQEGLVLAANIVAKSILSVQIAVVLTTTTEMTRLLAALRALKMPRLLVAVVAMMWRYIFVLAGEAQRLLRARASRSGSMRGNRAGQPDGDAYAAQGDLALSGSDLLGIERRLAASQRSRLLWRAQVTGGMAGNLMLRGLERADRTYAAMCARGYDGEIRSLPLPALSPLARIVLLSGCSGLGVLTLFSFLLWG